MAKYTPMIEQYLSVKEEAKDAFLFFRLGDFYEMFFDDAILAAKELEITLTGRAGGADEKIPMCGVPYHSAENYIQRLIEKGYKVAICEQVEDPAAAKGVVRREIVRVVTPGTVMEGKAVSEKSNNYMVAVTEIDRVMAIAACDLSTGELHVTSAPSSQEWLRDEIGIYSPSEIIGDERLLTWIKDQSGPLGKPVVYSPRSKAQDEVGRKQFGEAAWIRLEPERRACVAMLVAYLGETQKRSLGQLSRISAYEPEQYMILDPFTRRNLELVETVRDRSKKGSLLYLLDRTETSMGARLLRRWVDKPLLSRSQVEVRLEAVEELHGAFMLREDLKEKLKGIYDLERLVGRIAFGTANGRDLNALKMSLLQIPELKELCSGSASATLGRIASGMDDCGDLASLIEEAIADEPPVSVRDGGLIRPGFNEKLDELREASKNGKRWIADLEAAERQATGIKSLKVGYNKVFGYYIEITKSNLTSLPEGRYERKQTLANAERFVTPELKERESLILEAEDRMLDLEYGLFSDVRDQLSANIPRLQRLAEAVAEIDVLRSLAAVSAESGFVKPVLTDGYDFIVENGRHPVVETVMEGSSFIANGTNLKRDASILLITGPNMAGKSTYMRQVALISIMAQIGCFVPAARAEIPMVDRIFTRIGAADDLIGGQSTFMVEMADIQVMTEKATPRSLIIIDELGRGTSTTEGIAIAQAVIEYVHDVIGCKALVSTHFHELAHLESGLSGLRNYSMAVQESGDKVHFLRKLVPGAASTSYGIYCAKLAGLPAAITDRASSLLDDLEKASVLEAGFTAGEGSYSERGQAGERAGRHVVHDDVHDVRERQPELAGGWEESGGGGLTLSGIRLPGSGGLEPQHEGAESGASALAEASASAETAVQAAPESASQAAVGSATAESAPAAGQDVVQLSIFGDEQAESPVSSSPASVKEEAKLRGLVKQLKQADIMNMTPLQAMGLLNELKMKAKDL
ncbi:DNA mismatch repair protein MutS [Paenibacillus physcomitrellae]|uniref:DNA mismatch repair protein MutS n=1 Tax=Paenibacillus physcomitrellae TaxID=1619311 RepID=A0ABQ1FQZ9_9BACL|nr:DNA mismatch repair protein MutS [Paenibacillus physcomitrellae]GGA24753.1 DNA mismatch repair protein MutS [Paenibacillus physcomitrellae]